MKLSVAQYKQVIQAEDLWPNESHIEDERILVVGKGEVEDFNPDEYPGTQQIRILGGIIWCPDLNHKDQASFFRQCLGKLIREIICLEIKKSDRHVVDSFIKKHKFKIL